MADYRETTTVLAPAALREGTLARLGNTALAYPLSFSVGAILSAAGLAAAVSLIITTTAVTRNEATSPPSFFDDTPATSWFLAP